jgi:nucleotide-binding universal stress UspA family protein
MNAPDGLVLIAYDGSPAARQAVADAAKLLGSCRMLVVTVWEEGLAHLTRGRRSTWTTIGQMVDPDVALDIDHEQHRHAERVSREGAELARSLGVDAEPLAVPDAGGVPRTILHEARERQAVAIVVGSRGLSGLRGSLLEGSTSKGVLKHAPCPVIVVHQRDQGDD